MLTKCNKRKKTKNKKRTRRKKNPSAKRKFEDGANGRCCNLGTGMHFWTRK